MDSGERPKITTRRRVKVEVHARWGSKGPPRLWNCKGVPGKADQQKRPHVLLWHRQQSSQWLESSKNKRQGNPEHDQGESWKQLGRAVCKADPNAGALQQESQPVWEKRWAPKKLTLGGWLVPPADSSKRLPWVNWGEKSPASESLFSPQLRADQIQSCRETIFFWPVCQSVAAPLTVETHLALISCLLFLDAGIINRCLQAQLPGKISGRICWSASEN